MNTQSARNVKEFVHVLSRDDQGRPTRLLVPGHEGRRYEVSLSRNGGLVAHCEQRGLYGYTFVAICEGSLHNVCYHILAACMVAAEEQGKEIEWHGSGKPHPYLDQEGEVFSIKSAQSGKIAWGFVYQEKSDLAPANLSQKALIALALEKTGDKSQWFVGESIRLADDAFLKNDDGMVRLYRVDKSQKFPLPVVLATVYRLDPRSGAWKPQAQLTRQQAEADLFDRDSALPVERKRGRSMLFKT